jgi:hypothetical protein
MEVGQDKEREKCQQKLIFLPSPFVGKCMIPQRGREDNLSHYT